MTTIQRFAKRLAAGLALVCALATAAGAATPLVMYLDTTPSSGAVASLADTSTGTALNLTGTNLTGTSIGAGVGATYGSTSGAVSAALGGTKVATAMLGATAATIEAVADTTSYTGFNQIMGLSANGANGIFVLVTGSSGVNEVGVGGGGASAWYDVTPGLHHFLAVYDSGQATSTNRILLYVDGAAATVDSSPFAPVYPALNLAIDTGFNTYASNQITIGCLTSAGTEAFVGPIYMGIMYASALTSADATSHSAAALANNDADPNVGVAATFTGDAPGQWSLSWSPPPAVTVGGLRARRPIEVVEAPLVPWVASLPVGLPRARVSL